MLILTFAELQTSHKYDSVAVTWQFYKPATSWKALKFIWPFDPAILAIFYQNVIIMGCVVKAMEWLWSCLLASQQTFHLQIWVPQHGLIFFQLRKFCLLVSKPAWQFTNMIVCANIATNHAIFKYDILVIGCSKWDV